jgi:hypothetical protein
MITAVWLRPASQADRKRFGQNPGLQLGMQLTAAVLQKIRLAQKWSSSLRCEVQISRPAEDKHRLQ